MRPQASHVAEPTGEKVWLEACRNSMAAANALSVRFDSIDILENANYFAFCHEALGQAQRRIVVSMGRMTSSARRSHPARQLIEQVIATHRRGVSVDVFTAAAQEYGSRERRAATSSLRGAGVSVHCAPVGHSFHHKAVVIDDSLTIIGSHNWTWPALQENRELSIAIRSTELAYRTAQAISVAFVGL